MRALIRFSIIVVALLSVSSLLFAGGQTEEQESKVLKVATVLDPFVTNPHGRREASATFYCAIFDQLTQYDVNNNPQPRLAENWEWSDDYTELTMNLRQGVLFHSGRELTAEDVLWNYQRVMNPDKLSNLRAGFAPIKDMKVVDRYSLVIELHEPVTNIFDAFETFNIMDPESEVATENGEVLVGTGPFKFVEFVPGNRLVLEKNEQYWQSGKPYLDGLEILVVPDSEAMVLNLESNAADVIVSPPIGAVERFKRSDDYSVLISPNEAPRYRVAINVTKEPFDNKLVRQAINHLIDRDRFAKEVTRGLTSPTALVWNSGSPANDTELAASIRLDYDRARELFKQAGVDPSKLELDVMVFDGLSDLEEFATIFQADLEAVGISIPGGMDLEQTVVWQDRGRNMDYDISVGLHNNHNLDPATLLMGSGTWRALKATSNGFFSEEYKAMVEELASTFNKDRQQELYRMINEFLLDQAFTLPFGNGVYSWVSRAGEVSGISSNKFNWMHYEDVKLAK